MIRLIALLLLLVAPRPAFALSCLAPLVTRSFETFAAAEETYVIVHGRVTFEAKRLPKALSMDRNPPQMTRIPARLVGKSMRTNGFKLPFDQAITLEVSCLGPWCGGIQNGADLLAFVRKEEGGYALAIPPCGGSAFDSPKPAQLKRVKQCFGDGACALD